jgi:hypothetical protein
MKYFWDALLKEQQKMYHQMDKTVEMLPLLMITGKSMKIQQSVITVKR